MGSTICKQHNFDDTVEEDYSAYAETESDVHTVNTIDLNSDLRINGEMPTFKSSQIFVPPVHVGYVVKVYDGDTITIATKLPIVNDDTIYRCSVRLLGIDCPELRGPHTDPSEKRISIEGRDALKERIFNKFVILHEVSIEKYGRLLAYVYFEGENMNEWMINEKWAVPYDGGTKNIPASWEEYHNS